jgi:hypothetical protein
MNCQNFESIVGDLARGVLMEARSLAEAGAHEGVCVRCAARLSDERALSAGLRGLAASAGAEAAPPRVEANLLAAFRAQAAAGAQARVETSAVEASAPAFPNADDKVVPLAIPSARRRWSWAKSAAASATAAAAAVALFVLVAPRRPAPNAVSTKQTLATPGAVEASRQAARTLPAVPPPVEVSDGGPERDVAGVIPHAPVASRVNAGRPSVRGATPASYRGGSSRVSRAARGTAADELEIATDFIPLTQDARSALAEGGQVVRVELPRTALQRFGLPMNVEQSGGRVKADVMLGYDGVARAIRFVR